MFGSLRLPRQLGLQNLYFSLNQLSPGGQMALKESEDRTNHVYIGEKQANDNVDPPLF